MVRRRALVQWRLRGRRAFTWLMVVLCSGALLYGCTNPPELLTVVWMGLDNRQPLGLSGAQAALPIWTAFMTKALAGRASPPFEAPAGVTFVEIDRDTGKLATPNCPRVTNEAFLSGTEPGEVCALHRF